MEELIRNFSPLIGGALICLIAWLDLRRMHRGRRAAEKSSPDPAE